MRRLLPSAVFVVAFIVLLGGHGLGHPALVYLVPGGAAMQPLTALSLLAASLVVVLAQRADGILSFSALSGLVAYMTGLGVAGWSGVSGFLGLLPSEGVFASDPPSLGTLAALGLIELVGLRALFGYRTPQVGWLLVAISAVAILGYAVDAPTLYYDGTWGPGMAIHTALCVMALGLAITDRSHVPAGSAEEEG